MDACLADLFINLPELAYPIDFTTIHRHQQAEQTILQKLQDDPDHYQYRNFGEIDLICRLDRNNDPKIVLPPDLEHPTIECYNEMLRHSGVT